MIQRKASFKRILVGLLALVMAAGLVVPGLIEIDTAHAVTSLPHIMEILRSQTKFNILEIVPEEGSGSLGYYVAGQEPFKSWAEAFADSSIFTSPDDRELYTNGLLTTLSGAGLISHTTATPITYTGGTSYTYDENYPWELSSLTGYTALTLPQFEYSNVNGTFSSAPGTGFYDGRYDYVLAAGSGTHLQKISYLTYAPDGSSTPDTYYYKPVFFQIPTMSNVDAYEGQAAYVENCVYNTTITASTVRDPGVTYYLSTESGFAKIKPEIDFNSLIGRDIYTSAGTYSFYGYFGSSISLNINVEYFVITSTGEPRSASGGGFNYGSDSTEFISKPASVTGHFNRTITGYEYIAGHTGNFNFTPSATGDSQLVFTDTVYYKGHLSNNNWFKSKVFNLDGSPPGNIDVVIKTATPTQVTQNMVTEADLIVLSAGFNSNTPTGSLVGLYSTTNDLSPAIAFNIYDSVLRKGLPLVVDYRLTEQDESPTIIKLAQLSLLPYTSAITASNFSTYSYSWSSMSTENRVNGNVLSFSPPFAFASGSTINALASGHFASPLSSSVVSSGFASVLTEIKNENFLRKVDNPSTTDLLPEQVTLASAIRYIINHAGKRTTTAKNSIKVLDLEPGKATTGALKKSTVIGWLGGPTNSPFDEEDITIVTMSTAEFIGKIEDLNETYDMVYIGTSTDGFNTSGGTTVYNDTSMNGLVYTNIGDTYRSSKLMGGLLGRDYYNSNTLNFTSGSSVNLFRFSGNDITPSKVQELLYFADAGYPIVIANDVFNSTTSPTSSQFRVDIVSATTSGNNTITITASAVNEVTGTPIDATYEWYRNGSRLTSESSSTLTRTESSNGTYTYYCLATATGGGAGSTKARSVTVTAVRSSSFNVSIDEEGGRTPGTYGGTVSFNANNTASQTGNINRNTNVTFTATARDSSNLPLSGVNVTYQWEMQYRTYEYSWFWGGSWSSWSSWSNISGATNRTYTTSGDYDVEIRYRVKIYVNGSSDNALSTYYTVGRIGNNNRYNVSSSNSGSAQGSFPLSSISFNAKVTGSVSGNTVTLNASPVTATDQTLTGFNNIRYRWYREGSSSSVSSNASYSFDASRTTLPATYYCVIRLDNNSSYEATSYRVIVSRSGFSASVGTTGAYSGTFTSTVHNSSGTINTNRIDSASYIYSALNNIKNRKNVMSVSEIDSFTLQGYLNLTKPEIVFANESDYPTVYSVNSSGVMSFLTPVGGVHYLTYKFRIKNETDPTPATTTYDVNLYLDLNADGRYSDAEELDDIAVTRGGTRLFPNRDVSGREYYSLKADIEYVVTREVPEQYVGIIPWNLEVVKNGAPRIHTSQHNYTRIAPSSTPQQIKILQIAADGGSGGSLNLQTQLETATGTDRHANLRGNNGTYYKGIYGKLLSDVTDFNVTITTIESSNLENLNFNPKVGSTNVDKIFNYLDTYDMLIIGFLDMYAEVRANTATALVRYIEGGKSILFTHDTTSLVNVPTSSFQARFSSTNTSSAGFGNPAHWGYYFNTIIRDVVGLDRYGITSKKSIGTNTIQSILYGQTDATSVGTNVDSIRGNNYTVAFRPKTTSNQTVPETQGFTNYSLIRYDQGGQLNYRAGSYGARETTYISQVNEGQITTYPYNINTAAFRDPTNSNNRMSVGLTHEQYYQLNMNSDDIVVWFCLSDNGSGGYYYSDIPNDVTNAYYIYNRGNVTYSGVGHTHGSGNYTGNNVSEAIKNEAKLFVNTMIAAYQSGTQAPTISIKDPTTGIADLDYMYVVSDLDTNSIMENPTSPARAMYFRLSDTNLDASKVINVSFTYGLSATGGTAFTPIGGNIYQSNGATVTNLRGNTLYHIYLPDVVLDALKPANVSSVTLTVTVSTTISGSTLTGSDSVELRKIDLFNMR